MLRRSERIHLAATLDLAGEALREAAADQAYRRDAMRSIREFDLARYHQDRWVSNLDLWHRLADAADLLRDDELWPQAEEAFLWAQPPLMP